MAEITLDGDELEGSSHFSSRKSTEKPEEQKEDAVTPPWSSS